MPSVIRSCAVDHATAAQQPAPSLPRARSVAYSAKESSSQA
ncbi:hypothetical protein [Streptomyces sp. NRRL S-241]|nr:hypothetical protein [Streptomyces sp. NRRL S-241]